MYCDDIFSQRNFEKFMHTIPNFAPRGHGLFIPKAELTLYENPNPPLTSLNDAIKKTMSAIYCPPFQRRLEQYLKESEDSPMDYGNEKHMTNPSATFEIMTPDGNIRITPEDSKALLDGYRQSVKIGNVTYAADELLDQKVTDMQTDLFDQSLIRMKTEEPEETMTMSIVGG